MLCCLAENLDIRTKKKDLWKKNHEIRLDWTQKVGLALMRLPHFCAYSNLKCPREQLNPTQRRIPSVPRGTRTPVRPTDSRGFFWFMISLAVLRPVFLPKLTCMKTVITYFIMTINMFTLAVNRKTKTRRTRFYEIAGKIFCASARFSSFSLRRKSWVLSQMIVRFLPGANIGGDKGHEAEAVNERQ